jgi:hypothetical protein
MSGSKPVPILLLALACLMTGCASPRSPHTGLDLDQGIAAAEPPAFLIGPASVLLTNSSPYSSRAVLSNTNGPLSDLVNGAGNLLQQDGVLLFVPTSTDGGGKTGWEGTFRFLWDVANGRGYVMSEVLQAYAPLSSSNRYQVLPAAGGLRPPVLETIEGQSCQVEDVTVSSSSGKSDLFRTWRATEMEGQLFKLMSLNEVPAFLLRLSEVKTDPMSAELFAPPEGFVRYKSGEAMAREIMHRQMLARYRPFSSEGNPGRRRAR